MKVLFSTNTLNYRGTTSAILDYAKYNQEILGNESIITYNECVADEVDMGNEQSVVQEIGKRFRLISNEGLVNPIAEREKVDLVYRLGSGEPIKERMLIRNVYHAAFTFKNEEITAYISKWLSKEMTDGKTPFVHHIVNLPEPVKDYRNNFNIPKDAVVIGRHGGYHTFDIPFVKEYVKKRVEVDNNIYFLFLNTKPFIKHERVIHIGPTTDKQKISNYINTCDAMLHARHRGESFGLAMAEFLFHNKPVFSWVGGIDRNHHLLTKYLYNNARELNDMINDVKYIKEDYTELMKNFTPSVVMETFDNYFIKGMKII